ncbi:Golgi resident protein GCP60 [Amphibalanus amphitrite]|uniref:Golgi resident protein GCP60 n=1 Tax=Amphibalanus amphitrite TaxID=1232801 RepID=A0A6A4W3B5_AMPAM|nr:Golgi resident protein GCP60 [Amphibalanus amphitrite]
MSLYDIRRLAEAKMWIRGDLEQFKATIRSERTRGVQTVGQGQVVTVRVPARADGTCLFWEFATDGFDLGFGVWFEWGPTTQYEVTVEVSEGADEEQPPGEEGAVSSPGQVAEDRPARISCVVPVYRRDCHLHVYAGSHRFPAHEGVYLLKFDNSYSLWRAKTLYYRVFYTR